MKEDRKLLLNEDAVKDNFKTLTKLTANRWDSMNETEQYFLSRQALNLLAWFNRYGGK